MNIRKSCVWLASASLCVLLSSCDSSNREFEVAMNDNMEDQYEQVLAKYPKHASAPVASEALRSLRLKNAQRSLDPEYAARYIKHYGAASGSAQEILVQKCTPILRAGNSAPACESLRDEIASPLAPDLACFVMGANIQGIVGENNELTDLRGSFSELQCGIVGKPKSAKTVPTMSRSLMYSAIHTTDFGMLILTQSNSLLSQRGGMLMTRRDQDRLREYLQ